MIERVAKKLQVDFPQFRRHLKVMVRGALKRLGTYSADMAVATSRIIEHFDVIEQVGTCIIPRSID